MAKRITIGLLLLWSLSGCQGGTGDRGIVDCFCDARGTPFDAYPGPGTHCNPVTQAGCEAGEKCGQLVERVDPTISYVTCLPDGTVQNGGTCSSGSVGAATGFDNCVGGYHCLEGACVEICDVNSLAGCATTEGNTAMVCTVFKDLFPRPVGVCTPVPTP